VTTLYTYSPDYVPEAPVLDIEIGIPDAEVFSGFHTALVDTGADTTVIPIDYLHAIQAEVVDRAFLRSPWDDRRTVSIYAVAMKIDNYLLNAVRVVGDDLGKEIILGRNVLNHLRILLDGPASIMELLEAL
jgi:predicted aspartyl protease